MSLADVCNTVSCGQSKRNIILSIVKSGNQTRHIYFQHQRLTLLLLPPLLLHQHYCHKHQLTAVSFVRTVATVCDAVTHRVLGDTFPLWALPVGSGALPVDWTTKKVIVFSVTCKHLRRHCISLSSFSYTSVFTTFVFLITLIHPPFSSRSLTFRVSFIHLYRQLHSTLLSHPFTSIGTPHIDIVISIGHHFFRSLLLSPPLPLNMPVRGLYGHGKGSYGHGLAHALPVPALYGHGKGASALTIFLFCFVNEVLNGKPLLLSWRHIEHFVVCVYFPTHRYQTASEFREHIALFQLGHNFLFQIDNRG